MVSSMGADESACWSKLLGNDSPNQDKIHLSFWLKNDKLNLLSFIKTEYE